MPLYFKFMDLEKAFNSIHWKSLWRILCHYGIPERMVNIVKMLYRDFSAQVICNNELNNAFKVNTGVKQGCNTSSFIFTLGMDWIMKEGREFVELAPVAEKT